MRPDFREGGPRRERPRAERRSGERRNGGTAEPRNGGTASGERRNGGAPERRRNEAASARQLRAAGVAARLGPQVAHAALGASLVALGRDAERALRRRLRLLPLAPEHDDRREDPDGGGDDQG